jgi:rhodanese-related sulfurtransferase
MGRLKLPLVLLATMLIGGALVAGVVLALNDGRLPTAVAPVSSTAQPAMPTQDVMVTLPAAPAAGAGAEAMPTAAAVNGGAEALPNPHSAPSDGAAIQRLSVADAKALFDAGTARFVDVRSGADFAKGHIANAVSITSTTMDEQLKDVSPETLLIVYGDKGVESAASGAQIFRDLGFAKVAALDGGIEAWQAQGFPVIAK